MTDSRPAARYEAMGAALRAEHEAASEMYDATLEQWKAAAAKPRAAISTVRPASVSFSAWSLPKP
jgi:hypothetical protein